MRYAKLADKPVVFMLGGATLATLDAEWHTRQVGKFDPLAVDKVHLTWPGSSWSVDLVHANGAWSVVGPGGYSRPRPRRYRLGRPGRLPPLHPTLLAIPRRGSRDDRPDSPPGCRRVLRPDASDPRPDSPSGDPIDPKQSYAATPDQPPRRGLPHRLRPLPPLAPDPGPPANRRATRRRLAPRPTPEPRTRRDRPPLDRPTLNLDNRAKNSVQSKVQFRPVRRQSRLSRVWERRSCFGLSLTPTRRSATRPAP